MGNFIGQLFGLTFERVREPVMIFRVLVFHMVQYWGMEKSWYNPWLLMDFDVPSKESNVASWEMPEL